MVLTQNGLTADSDLVTFCFPDPSFDHVNVAKSIIAVHDIECDLKAGMARSLIGPDYMGHGGDPGNPTSVHYMTDPVDIAQGVKEVDRAWHVGHNANDIAIGIEQAGRASMTRAEWVQTPGGLAEIHNTGLIIADICKRHPNIAPRRLSDAELKHVRELADADPTTPHPGGWVPHHQITTVLFGTTHTDPDPDYPYDLLQQEIDAAFNPPVTPAPKPVTPVQEDDMRLIETRDSENREVWAKLLGDGQLYYIGTPHGIDQVQAYLAAGVPSVQVSRDVYNNLPHAPGTNNVS